MIEIVSAVTIIAIAILTVMQGILFWEKFRKMDATILYLLKKATNLDIENDELKEHWLIEKRKREQLEIKIFEQNHKRTKNVKTQDNKDRKAD